MPMTDAKIYISFVAIAALFIITPSAIAEYAWRYHDYVVSCAAHGDTPIEDIPAFGIQRIHPRQ